MVQVNNNYSKLPGNYLFSEVARKKQAYLEAHPTAQLINMGIGDVTRPLFPAVIAAMQQAVDEMGQASSFRGYAPEQGYDFLRQLIAECDFQARGADISADEIFVSDGAKSDCANIGDIFALDNIVAVCDPVYPVYVDSNAMSGRAGEYQDGRWSKLVYLPCKKDNAFIPQLPQQPVDLIYLCFPNNPTGATATAAQLQQWVDYANAQGAVLLFDAAYEAFIRTPGLPHSIYEIEGAKTCAIEFRSFSKTAGFTGTRCAYTVVPKDLVVQGQSLRDMWYRRQCTKFNGVSYIVQRGAAAVYSAAGQQQLEETISYYMNNAAGIRKILQQAGLSICGGVDSPYIWLALPDGLSSWQAFDLLLQEAQVVTTPGSGFGSCGEGYLRMTAFGEPDSSLRAAEKIAAALR